MEASKKLDFLRGNFRLVIMWPVAALVIAAVGWSHLLARLDNERTQADAAALKQVSILARNYAIHLRRTMDSIDQMLLHVRNEWALSNGGLRLETAKETGLFQYTPPASSLDAFIIDPDGRVVTSTAIFKNDDVRVNGRSYFLTQKTASADSLYIGMPFHSLSLGKYIIPFSRRLTDREGDFNGVVMIAAEPGFLIEYDETALGAYGFLGVVGSDRYFRVTRTERKIYPPPPPGLTSLPYLISKSGSMLTEGEKSFIDKRDRYIGWAQVERYPLIALVGLDEQETLAPYWARRSDEIDYAIWASAGLALFTIIAMALSLRLAWRKHQHESTQATYRMATEGGNEGFYILHPVFGDNRTIVDFLLVDSNQRGAELFQHRREELIGKTVSIIYEGAGAERIMKMLREAMQTGAYEGEWEVPAESPFAVRWVHLKIVRADDNLAVTLRDISDTKAHVAALERQSNEDALTGLPNRHWVQTYLPKAIQHAAANNASLAVLFIDLDGFKAVNDTMGHEAGDEVLRNAARRLKEAVRPHDRVARLGGDEFVVLLDNIMHKADAAHVAERIQHAFQDGFRLAQGVHSVGASIGISIFPADGADAETLVRNADIAMYSVKTSGKRNYRFYDEQFYDALRARLEKEAELRHAIEHDQFVMYYQPRVDMATGKTSSMEALVRWAHPTKGLISPLDFIPLAEETGLILDLGELVIDKVCAQLRYWADRGQELVPVSVNVSSRQFNEANVAKIFSAALARHNIDPALIEIELTESSMMRESNEAANAVTAIQKMGIKLLVDDFGTGYSSLSQLQQMDFDVLKVDRAFTSKLDKSKEGNIFFKAIITMAHALGMRVVAEGVENMEQINILRSLKCDEIQGFYISEPLPPSDTQPVLPTRLFPWIS